MDHQPQQVYVWENTYITEPRENEKFFPAQIENVIKRVADEKLAEVEYEEGDAKKLTLELCNEIKGAVKEECSIPRHKIIVQVALGRNDGQGIRVASKCLWDTSCDSWASYTFCNRHLFAVCMVFGCYFE